MGICLATLNNCPFFNYKGIYLIIIFYMEEKIKCSYCKEEINKAATVCPHCKKDIRNWFVKHWIISFLLVSFVL
jgi:hypothetical protein